MSAPKILIVEDEKILAVHIRRSLQKLGYTVLDILDSREEAINTVTEINPSLVLIDICLTDIANSLQLADIIQNKFQIPILFITDYSKYQILHQNKLKEPFSYIVKPFSEQDLHVAIEIAIYKYKIYKKLQSEKQRLLSIIQSMGCAVVVTDINVCIQIMNPEAEILTGCNEHEVLGKNLVEVLTLVNKDTRENLNNLVTQAIETNTVLRLPDNCVLITKDGTEISIGDSVAPIRDNFGQVTGAVLVLQNIQERKQTEAQLLHNAFYDGLTALPNRVLFLDRLKQALEHCKRRQNYHFAVLFLDLDGFKGINDRFGHSMGDDFLIAIARRLESCLRSGDTVARFGGDEFAVLLEDIKDVSDAINVAKRIQETLKLPIYLNGYQLLTTASIGIALSEDGYEEPRNLLRDADAAMYRAKEQGKANYIIFDE
ncbi:diguanylate cyclase [Chlorogloeopsis sp. ULAP01]|uniref:diguanylate cyclase domain-containing protein n=1 Tax=Chlorogloeopsis sp. ULAP01 TaxID=3056483 RepID=UPI0025AA6F0F|nr:diguanylate cyclase [Chlorogloeopsis sp. ULAP01]MDM9382018.1 diguanylate cyclase [Chlorogloeopsis sp. ULAP01]